VAGNKQLEIVAAATRLFQQKGYHATSMQDIADAVALQKGSLYHYISSKEDLLVVIIHDAISQYNAQLAEVRGMDLPLRQKLELAVRHHLRGIADNLGMLTIFLRESYALNPEQQQMLAEESALYNRMFEELFVEGVRSGEIRGLDPKLATRTVLGACNWFYRWYRPGGDKSIAELSDFFVDLLFHGISAEPPPDDICFPM
jgi:AcrR family transcriptional regulator